MTNTATISRTLITGNTYPVKTQLAQLGGRWDPAAKGWLVPTDKADQARQLVGTAAPSRGSSGFRGRSYPYQRERNTEKCYCCGSTYCEGARGGLCDED